MGSGASNMSMEKLLSEEEVKALAGDFFDKSAFDTLKDANGFITTKQYSEIASQKIHSGQLFSSQEEESVVKDTNAGIEKKTIRLTRKSFSGSVNGGAVISASSEDESLEKSAMDLKALFSKFSPSGNMESAEFVKLLADKNIIDGKLSLDDASALYDAIKNKAILLGVKGGNITFDVFLTTAIPAVATQKGDPIPHMMAILSGQRDFAQSATGGTILAPAVTTTGGALVKKGSFTEGVNGSSRSIGSDGGRVNGSSRSIGSDGGSSGSVATKKKSSFIDGVATAMAIISGGGAAPAAAAGASGKSTRRSFSGAAAAEGGQRRRGTFPLIDVEDPINYKGPGDMIYPVFREFCPSGEMDSGAYTKLLRTAKLFDKPSMFPLAEAETLFRAARQKLNEPMVISFEIFHSFVLPQIAERRGESEDEVADLISCCNAPPSALRRSLSVRIRGPDGANAVDTAEKPSIPSSTRAGRNASMRRSFSQLDTIA